jgi:general stress protein CsbA
MIAIWEFLRSLRWVNFALGLWLILAPFLLGYPFSPFVNSIVVGILIASFALLKGKIEKRYGGGWSALWK